MRAAACAVAIVLLAAACDAAFRPPAVPLIVFSPYNSFWSMADHLTDDFTRHWSGQVSCMMGGIVVDGTPYRWMGPINSVWNSSAATQRSVTVNALQTVYDFSAGGVELTVTFSTPAFPADLTRVSLPITYITQQIRAIDGHTHDVQLYFDLDGELFTASNNEELAFQDVSFTSGAGTRVSALKMGTFAQGIMGQSGDFQRIDWGYAYIATDDTTGLSTTMAFADDSRAAFQFGVGRAPNSLLPPVNPRQPRTVDDQWPVIAMAWDVPNVGATPFVRRITYAYDEVYSINYFGDNLAPYWRHLYNNDPLKMIGDAIAKAEPLLTACTAEDNAIASMASAAGGAEYALITTLAYRQTTGAIATVWYPKYNASWIFMKEISSDGDVSTVDVIYPSSPFWLLLAPESLRLMLIPLLEYANNATYIPYPLTWAPHHLGVWPICDLPYYLQEQMPVEETGNLLSMIASIAEIQLLNGGETAAKIVEVTTTTGAVYRVPAVLQYLVKYWGLVQQWGTYLVTALPDPGNQLCTDDFEGPSPHNVNLAAKGIVGLAAYSKLQAWFGDSGGSAASMSTAQGFVADWMNAANDGDHYRLQYNLPNTWSMKYNLLFQPILNISTSELFPSSVFEMEENYYPQQMNAFGFPLDNRANFTKTDWMSWMGALSSQPSHQQAIWSAIVNFASNTPSRVPFSDWYDTKTAKQMAFQARPMNVTKSNFETAFKELCAHIDSADYIAIDEEMTGIRWCGSVGTPPTLERTEAFKQSDAAVLNQAQSASAGSAIHAIDDVPSERYAKMRPVASTYAIIQFGLCLFTKDRSAGANGRKYIARPFNYYLFPDGYESLSSSSFLSSFASPSSSTGVPHTACSQTSFLASSFYPFHIVMEADAIQFNKRNNMDFSKWIFEGVSYINSITEREWEKRLVSVEKKDLEKEEARALRERTFAERKSAAADADTAGKSSDALAVDRKSDSKSAAAGDESESKREPIVLQREEDKAFVATAIAALTAWLGDAKAANEFVFPECNSFLAVALTQHMSEHHPMIITEMRTTKESRYKRLVAMRYNRSERMQRLEEAKRTRQRECEERSGFRRVWKRLIAARKPIIGHNCMYDLMFAFSHFHEPLPVPATQFRRELNALFPVIFDTKYLAQSVTALNLPAVGPLRAASYRDTGVEPLYNLLTTENKEKPQPLVIELANEECYHRYAEGKDAVYHEAAYDAYHTGIIFLLLADRLAAATPAPPLAAPALDVSTYRNTLQVSKSYFHFSTDPAVPDARQYGGGDRGTTTLYMTLAGAAVPAVVLTEAQRKRRDEREAELKASGKYKAKPNTESGSDESSGAAVVLKRHKPVKLTTEELNALFAPVKPYFKWVSDTALFVSVPDAEVGATTQAFNQQKGALKKHELTLMSFDEFVAMKNKAIGLTAPESKSKGSAAPPAAAKPATTAVGAATATPAAAKLDDAPSSLLSRAAPHLIKSVLFGAGVALGWWLGTRRALNVKPSQ